MLYKKLPPPTKLVKPNVQTPQKADNVGPRLSAMHKKLRSFDAHKE